MSRRDPTAPPMTRSMKTEAAGARVLAALPPKLQVRLAGGKPVVRDGQTLDPATQLILAFIEKRGGGNAPGTLTVAHERALLRRQSIIGGGLPDRVAAVRDLQIDGAEDKIDARFYSSPELGGPHPLLVWYHGGGFVLGGLDSHDSVCRTLCLHSGVDVLAVDYRLAPEHPYPAGADDAVAAFEWAAANAADLGSDPTRLAVGGDSAGGNLAAVVAMDTARSLSRPPIAQLLFYPITDSVEKHESRSLFGTGFLLTSDLMDWFALQYAGSDDPEGDPSDPRVSPLLAKDHSGLAPAIVITAGFDPLRDEGEAYAAKLEAAGVEVIQRRFPDLIHGFTNMSGVSRAARDALLETCGVFRSVVRR